MPPKKPAARKPKAEPAPEPVTVEGFTVVEYEGMDLLSCERDDFDTFDIGSAKAHAREHVRTDANAAELQDITEHLADRAQVTEEPEDAEG